MFGIMLQQRRLYACCDCGSSTRSSCGPTALDDSILIGIAGHLDRLLLDETPLDQLPLDHPPIGQPVLDLLLLNLPSLGRLRLN